MISKNIAARPRPTSSNFNAGEYHRGQLIYSVELDENGDAYVQEWVVRTVRRRVCFLTMRIEGTTSVNGFWLDAIHPKYKLQFSFLPGTRNPLPSNFFINLADTGISGEKRCGGANKYRVKHENFRLRGSLCQ